MIQLTETLAKCQEENVALRARLAEVEAQRETLKEALEKIRDYNSYSHPDSDVIEARNKMLEESAQCTACQYAKERQWPPSGLCEKHYGPVMRAYDSVTEMFDYKQKWEPQNIAREALAKLDGGE